MWLQWIVRIIRCRNDLDSKELFSKAKKLHDRRDPERESKAKLNIEWIKEMIEKPHLASIFWRHKSIYYVSVYIQIPLVLACSKPGFWLVCHHTPTFYSAVFKVTRNLWWKFGTLFEAATTPRSRRQRRRGGKGMRRGYRPPHPTRGPGERHKLLQRSPGRPGRKWIWWVLS